jgi:RNA polymerase sigma factor (sigma-70 family)
MAHPALELLFGPIGGDGNERSSRFPLEGTNLLDGGTAEATRSPDRRLERIRGGDKTVLAQLYDTYFGQLAAFAFRFIHDKNAAQDVVHDVFLRMWSIRETIEVRTTLEAYLFGAVANRARNVVSQARREDARFRSIDDIDVRVGDVSSENISPHDVLEASDMLQAITAAVAALPERQRLALTLRLSKDMTYEEIGAVLGITKASVAELLRKAQAHLKPVLGVLWP